MTMPSLWLATRPAAYWILVLVALLAVVPDADAKGAKRSATRSSASSKGESSGISINLPRPGSSSSSTESTEADPLTGGRAAPTRKPGSSRKSDAAMTPEEAARHAALRAADERDQAQKAAEKAAARQAAVEKAEAERVAAEQAAAARKAAEDKAKADQLAAAQRQKQREEAAVASDVDRVLQRAKADYPTLNTPEGQPLLGRIVERQKALAATGMYPSQAMVRAVADHEYLLQPVVAKAPPPAAQAAQAAQQAPAGQAQAVGGCRWVTSIQWACK